jgi:hypothetical protein
MRRSLSGVISATARLILALRSSTFAGKYGKYTQSLRNRHTKSM